MSELVDAWADGPLKREVERLESENAKLREQGARLFDKTLELGTENATLRQQLADATESMGRVEERCARMRKLAEDMLPFIAEESGFCTADCFMYPACCDYDGDEECPAVARIHERARELGVDA